MHQEDFIPLNANAEKALIGSLLLEDKILGMLQGAGLVREMFYDPYLRGVYDVIVRLQQHDKRIDLPIVSDIMIREDPNVAADDIRLQDCVDLSFGSSFSLSYLDALKEAHKLRTIRTTLHKGLKILNQPGVTDPDELLSTIKHDLSSISVTRAEKQSKEEVAEELIVESQTSKATGTAGIQSKWFPIQRKLAGYRSGKSVVLAARPKCGKTTFMCEEILFGAHELEIPSGIISIEMTRKEIIRKMAAGIAKVDTIKVDNGNASKEDLARFADALRFVARLPIEIVDDPMTIERLCATMRMMAASGVKRLGIDYLQLLSASNSTKAGSRQQEVAYWSNMITNTTKELDVSTLLLSQLSRAGVKDGEKPMLHHLRDSGSIEQDAAAVMFISELPATGPSFIPNARRMLIDIAANRFGPQGETTMYFVPEHQIFLTGDPEMQPDPPKKPVVMPPSSARKF